MASNLFHKFRTFFWISCSQERGYVGDSVHWFLRNTLPRYLSIIIDVVMKNGMEFLDLKLFKIYILGLMLV